MQAIDGEFELFNQVSQIELTGYPWIIGNTTCMTYG